jgi:Fe-S cluster biogenesis protein NfuA
MATPPAATRIYSELTPNPQTMKFVFDRVIATGSADFKTGQTTATSPLAKKLFGFPWTDGVYIGSDFVTVTKQDWVDWETLAEPLTDLMAEHIDRGEAVLVDAPDSVKAQSGNVITDADSEIVKAIKTVINNEIRPAVAQDGGDVTFQKYEERIVHLHMQGSCAGCPSSTYTLKEGIATRLRAAVPEIIDVVAAE